MILGLLDEATTAGARLSRACKVVGLTVRTVQRWRLRGGGDDLRRGPSSTPHNKLSAAEDEVVLEVVKSKEFYDLSPRQIVPRLADRGEYYASESHFYRMLRKSGLLHHRALSRPPTKRPKALTATGPDQVYSWDITYLRSRVRGVYFYLYLVVDIWSRRIVGWAIHDHECGDLAAALIERICADNPRSGNLLWLHSDNGAAMKSAPLLTMLTTLGISPSFSRPRVSNDNPYSEALFRTLKYRPSFPSRPFADIAAAIAWVGRFVQWYNTEHLHSAVNFVTPDDRHFGRHLKILSARSRVYAAARRRHPERWSGETRNWDPIRVVCLNPEYDNGSSKSKAKHA
jgi:putative transposase